ncbi:MAG TPA: hypothetical protein VGC80_08065 [Acetobacteraceae bacterium]
MRVVELAGVARRAETLRLRELAARTVRRVIFAVVAVLLGLLAFFFIHVFAVVAIAKATGPLWALVIVIALDLIVAGVLAQMALNSKPGHDEIAALNLRRTALAEMKAGAGRDMLGTAFRLALLWWTRRKR